MSDEKRVYYVFSRYIGWYWQHGDQISVYRAGISRPWGPEYGYELVKDGVKISTELITEKPILDYDVDSGGIVLG